MTGAAKVRSSSAETAGGRGADAELMTSALAALTGLRENCLMHGGYRRVPRRSKLGQPGKEAVDVASRGAHEAGAGSQRCQHRGKEAVSVKQRQHVQASIIFAQPQSLTGAEGRRADVRVGQRDSLRPRRRA